MGTSKNRIRSTRGIAHALSRFLDGLFPPCYCAPIPPAEKHHPHESVQTLSVRNHRLSGRRAIRRSNHSASKRHLSEEIRSPRHHPCKEVHNAEGGRDTSDKSSTRSARFTDSTFDTPRTAYPPVLQTPGEIYPVCERRVQDRDSDVDTRYGDLHRSRCRKRS